MNSKRTVLLLGLTFAITACTSGAAATPSPQAPTAAPPAATPLPQLPSPTPPPSSGTSPLFPPKTVDPADLDGRTFISQAVADEGIDHGLVAGTDVRLTFQGNNISANAGCNTMSGGYTIADGKLVATDNWATTEIGCQPALTAQDQWLANFLSSQPRITLNGDSMVLISGGTAMDLLDQELAEPDQPLVGITWGLTSMISGDAVSSVPVGITASLLLKEDGTVDVEPGCNSAGGNYVVDGNSITFTNLATTDMACVGPRMDVEAAVMQVLNAGRLTFAIDSNTLTLTAADGTGLQFSAAVDV